MTQNISKSLSAYTGGIPEATKKNTLMETPLFSPHTCICRPYFAKEKNVTKKITHAGGIIVLGKMMLLLMKGLSKGSFSPMNLTGINKGTFYITAI